MPKRALLAKLEVLRSAALYTTPLIVDKVVLQADDEERYIVVAWLWDAFKPQALFDNHLRYFSQADTLLAQITDPGYDLLLRVAPMNAIWRQDEQVIILSQLSCGPFWLRNHQLILLHLVVSKGTTHAQLVIDALVQDVAVGCLDPEPFILPVRRVLIVKLYPATVLVCKSRNWVTNVGHCEPTVEDQR